MKIVKGKNKYKYQIIVELNNVGDLIHFIKENNIKTNFLDFNIKFKNKIENDIKNIDVIFYKKFINWLNTFFPGKNSIRTLEYWINRGYSNTEAKTQLYNYQSKFGKIYDWNKHPEKMNTKIEFWLDKGYSKKDANQKLKERQKTFTLEKCIQKYGKNEGTKKYNERQKKWITSLLKNNNIDELNHKKGNNGLNKIKKLEEFIDFYGELEGKKRFADRYWKIKIKSIKQFNKIRKLRFKQRTEKFYNKEYRLQILKEQNFCCGNCDVENTKRLFHLHHIDYNKQNDNRNNLIFLCHNCHSKTTNYKNIDFFKQYYININKKYLKNEEKI